jgi:hypothetical protein
MGLLHKIADAIALSFVQSLVFGGVLFLLERCGIILVSVVYLTESLYIGEAALFLFLMLFIANFVVELLKSVFMPK